VDLWAGCIQAGAWSGVGLSPVSVVGHCRQATPPSTPRIDGQNRGVLRRDCSGRRAVQCFSTTRSLAHHTRPNRDPSRPVLAWPLRRRPLPDDAGYVPFPMGKFEQGFLDGHGPAQVGLGPPFKKGWLHRLRLSQQHLRLTPVARAANRVPDDDAWSAPTSRPARPPS
jgi:hypothetical protein